MPQHEKQKSCDFYTSLYSKGFLSSKNSNNNNI